MEFEIEKAIPSRVLMPASAAVCGVAVVGFAVARAIHLARVAAERWWNFVGLHS